MTTCFGLTSTSRIFFFCRKRHHLTSKFLILALGTACPDQTCWGEYVIEYPRQWSVGDILLQGSRRTWSNIEVDAISSCDCGRDIAAEFWTPRKVRSWFYAWCFMLKIVPFATGMVAIIANGKDSNARDHGLKNPTATYTMKHKNNIFKFLFNLKVFPFRGVCLPFPLCDPTRLVRTDSPMLSKCGRWKSDRRFQVLVRWR